MDQDTYTFAIKLSIFLYDPDSRSNEKEFEFWVFICHVHLYFGYQIWIISISYIHYWAFFAKCSSGSCKNIMALTENCRLLIATQMMTSGASFFVNKLGILSQKQSIFEKQCCLITFELCLLQGA